MVVIVDQQHGLRSGVRSQKCILPSFTHLDFTILEATSHILTTTSFPRSFSTPCLTLTTRPKEDTNPTPRVEMIGGESAPKARALVAEVAIAMATSDTNLIPVSSGLGGAYFLCRRNGEKIAVAKPIDEEPLALKLSVGVGESGIRELAAYLLDHGAFAGVPPTALVRFSHLEFRTNKNKSCNSTNNVSKKSYKIASLQRYVQHDSDAGDLGPSGFSVSSVHRIGILDIRLHNIDRHSGNVLVGKYEHDKYSIGASELIPIDHGLCLPEWLNNPYLEWLYWPQALVPFSKSEMNYIAKLDPYEDAKLLRAQVPRLNESSIRVMVVCTLFLKRAASSGLCLGDIGEMMTRDCRGGEKTMSTLESVCDKAKDVVFKKHNVGGTSFGDMEEDAWEFFLEMFDKFLPWRNHKDQIFRL